MPSRFRKAQSEDEGVGGRPQKSRRRVIIEWVVTAALVLLASLLIRTFAFQTFYIPSKSMKPTLHIGDRIVVNKLSVEFGTINLGDIVVFKAPPDVVKDCHDPVADLVKRVIGLPGDHLTSKGNTIYVNGKRLRENWTHWEPLGPAIGNVTVPAGRYFMMGDNHANSCDSRRWGTVPRSDIIGKVFLRLWPIHRFSWFQLDSWQRCGLFPGSFDPQTCDVGPPTSTISSFWGVSAFLSFATLNGVDVVFRYFDSEVSPIREPMLLYWT